MFVFFFLMIRRPPRSTRTDTLFPYTTLFRSSKQLEIFPDAVCETATRVDWLSHTTAPTPEQSQLAADLLVALGYVGALVEPSFKVGCLTIARSRVLQEVKVVGLHAVVKTHIQHSEADLLAEHILNAKSEERRVGKECVCMVKVRW